MSHHTKKTARKGSFVNFRNGQLHDRASETNGAHPSIDEQIRLRAYELYVERGAQPNEDLRDWLQAEREVRAGPVVETPDDTAS
ncbi:MAG: DUF2934 domain-containing protein [Gemmatimonadales bacterium]|jgi:hypothetical protein